MVVSDTGTVVCVVDVTAVVVTVVEGFVVVTLVVVTGFVVVGLVVVGLVVVVVGFVVVVVGLVVVVVGFSVISGFVFPVQATKERNIIVAVIIEIIFFSILSPVNQFTIPILTYFTIHFK